MIDLTSPGFSAGLNFQRIVITLVYLAVFAAGGLIIAAFFQSTHFRGRFSSREVNDVKGHVIAGLILSFVTLIAGYIFSTWANQTYHHTAVLLQAVVTLLCPVIWLIPAFAITRIAGSPVPILLLGIIGLNLFLRSFQPLTRFFYSVKFGINISLDTLVNATDFLSAVFIIFTLIGSAVCGYFSFQKPAVTRSIFSIGFTLWLVTMTPAFIHKNFLNTGSGNVSGIFITWLLATALVTSLVILLNLAPGKVMPKKDITYLILAEGSFVLLTITLLGNITLVP